MNNQVEKERLTTRWFLICIALFIIFGGGMTNREVERHEEEMAHQETQSKLQASEARLAEMQGDLRRKLFEQRLVNAMRSQHLETGKGDGFLLVMAAEYADVALKPDVRPNVMFELEQVSYPKPPKWKPGDHIYPRFDRIAGGLKYKLVKDRLVSEVPSYLFRHQSGTLSANYRWENGESYHVYVNLRGPIIPKNAADQKKLLESWPHLVTNYIDRPKNL